MGETVYMVEDLLHNQSLTTQQTSENNFIQYSTSF